MSQIGVSFTPNAGSPSYSFTFTEFTGTELPRTYLDGFSFSNSANGANIITGAPYSQKYLWAISTPIAKADAITFDAMFKAWDTDRSNGLAAAVAVVDDTFGPQVSTNAVFSTNPTYDRWGPAFVLVSFGLTEV